MSTSLGDAYSTFRMAFLKKSISLLRIRYMLGVIRFINQARAQITGQNVDWSIPEFVPLIDCEFLDIKRRFED